MLIFRLVSERTEKSPPFFNNNFIKFTRSHKTEFSIADIQLNQFLNIKKNILQPGIYTIPVNFQIPTNQPPSCRVDYSSFKGKIQYRLKASLNNTNWFYDYNSISVTIKVFPSIDQVNRQLNLSKSTFCKVEKSFLVGSPCKIKLTANEDVVAIGDTVKGNKSLFFLFFYFNFAIFQYLCAFLFLIIFLNKLFYYFLY